jgi:hypothetical protein
MIDWEFDAEQAKTENKFSLIPIGDCRIRIKETEELTSAKGNDMIKFTFDVSGTPRKLFYYLVFTKDNPAMTNSKLAAIYDSFGITVKNLDHTSWWGLTGGCRVKHEKYNDEDREKLHFFLSKEQQDKLPAWQDAAGNTTSAPTASISDDDIPF